MRDNQRRNNDDKARYNTKGKVIGELQKHWTTALIGILDRIEKKIGYLWGFGKEEGDFTEEEEKFYESWELLRKDILDHGHSEKRKVLDFLQDIEMSERQSYDFIVKPYRRGQ